MNPPSPSAPLFGLSDASLVNALARQPNTSKTPHTASSQQAKTHSGNIIQISLHLPFFR